MENKVNEEKLNEENIKEEEKLEKKDKTEEIKEPSLEEQIADLQNQVNDWKKEYAIKLADFENYKKRKDKEFMEYKKYACESLILKQIESLDILSMAINSAKSNNDMKSLLDGLEMLSKSIMTYLTDEGLEEVEAEGIKYDPYKHHAVSTISDENLEDDVVATVLQKGYKLKGKIIRPAMVSINKKDK